VSKRQRFFIVLVIAAVLAGAGYGWFFARQTEHSGDALTLYGNVDIREIRLAFNGSEHVADITVEEGDRVEPGEVLASLKKERLRAVRDRHAAELVAAQAAAHAARLTYERIRTLAARKLASSEEADEAEAHSRAADAQVLAFEAALAEAEQALDDADLHAPVSAVVQERIVEPGDFVTPQTPVLTLALTDPVWVRTYVPESYLGKIRPGDSALVSTDSYPGKFYEGWVGFVSPTAEFTPKNVETPELRTRLVYQVRVFVCNPQQELRLGMPATVRIAPGQPPAEVVPAAERCGPDGNAAQ
jgi:HlyD family secretion protein